MTHSGKVYAWGYNNDGRLSLRRSNNSNSSNYVVKPTLIPFFEEAENSRITIESVTATVDHSTMKDLSGNVYVWGCQRNSPIVKNKRKEKALIWTNKFSPFLITKHNVNNTKARHVSSCRRRIVMTGADGHVYVIGQRFKQSDNTITDEFELVNTKDSGKNVSYPVLSSCVGETFLYILCSDGKVYSRNKGENDEFCVVYMHKDYAFKNYQCKRDDVLIDILYMINCNEQFYAVSTRDDIFEWKAPSTQASYFGTIAGICDISCGMNANGNIHAIACSLAGDVYVWGKETKFKAINHKLRMQLNEMENVQKQINEESDKKGFYFECDRNKNSRGGGGGKNKNKNNLNSNSNRNKKNSKKNHKQNTQNKSKKKIIERVPNLSQVARVFAATDSVFMIKTILWPERDALRKNKYYREMLNLRGFKEGSYLIVKKPQTIDENEQLSNETNPNTANKEDDGGDESDGNESETELKMEIAQQQQDERKKDQENTEKKVEKEKSKGKGKEQSPTNRQQKNKQSPGKNKQNKNKNQRNNNNFNKGGKKKGKKKGKQQNQGKKQGKQKQQAKAKKQKQQKGQKGSGKKNQQKNINKKKNNNKSKQTGSGKKGKSSNNKTKRNTNRGIVGLGYDSDESISVSFDDSSYSSDGGIDSESSSGEYAGGIDFEELIRKPSNVPTLVSYCENVMMDQLSIDDIISNYKESFRLGLHRLCVYLVFMIVENMEHFIDIIISECNEYEIDLIEQLFHKYYPNMSTPTLYYGRSDWYESVKRIVDYYRLIQKKYPNYKSQLQRINQKLKIINGIDAKLNALEKTYNSKAASNEESEEDENEDSDNDNGEDNSDESEILYLSSENESQSESESEDSDQHYSLTKKQLNKRFKVLDISAEDRQLYFEKSDLIVEKNNLLFKMSDCEAFPSMQSMSKLKKENKKFWVEFQAMSQNRELDRQRMINSTFEDYSKYDNRFDTNDALFREFGISSNYNAVSYLNYLNKKSEMKQEKDSKDIEIGMIYNIDYDKYKRPRKGCSRATKHKPFDVSKAIKDDLKKAQQMDNQGFVFKPNHPDPKKQRYYRRLKREEEERVRLELAKIEAQRQAELAELETTDDEDDESDDSDYNSDNDSSYESDQDSDDNDTGDESENENSEVEDDNENESVDSFVDVAIETKKQPKKRKRKRKKKGQSGEASEEARTVHVDQGGANRQRLQQGQNRNQSGDNRNQRRKNNSNNNKQQQSQATHQQRQQAQRANVSPNQRPRAQVQRQRQQMPQRQTQQQQQQHSQQRQYPARQNRQQIQRQGQQSPQYGNYSPTIQHQQHQQHQQQYNNNYNTNWQSNSMNRSSPQMRHSNIQHPQPPTPTKTAQHHVRQNTGPSPRGWNFQNLNNASPRQTATAPNHNQYHSNFEQRQQQSQHSQHSQQQRYNEDQSGKNKSSNIMDVIRRERFKKDKSSNTNDENANVDIWDLDETAQFKSKQSNKSNKSNKSRKSKQGATPGQKSNVTPGYSLDDILEEQRHQVQVRAQRKTQEAIEKLDIQ